jgi:hypothetical protein
MTHHIHTHTHTHMRACRETKLRKYIHINDIKYLHFQLNKTVTVPKPTKFSIKQKKKPSDWLWCWCFWLTDHRTEREREKLIPYPQDIPSIMFLGTEAITYTKPASVRTCHDSNNTITLYKHRYKRTMILFVITYYSVCINGCIWEDKAWLWAIVPYNGMDVLK